MVDNEYSILPLFLKVFDFGSCAHKLLSIDLVTALADGLVSV